jgi:predicted dehydrogenase
MLNLALIGCGVIAQHHLRALAKMTTARAAAVCDLRPELAEQTAAAFGVARWTTSATELFTDPAIDGVVLALPACARTALALEAFAHGKHVLTEKPVAMNAAEVLALLAAQGDRVAACCSSRYRFPASAEAAREVIRRGALGPLRTLTCRGVYPAGKPPVNPPPAWRLRRALNGGGILLNWGVYDLDYMLGLLDFRLTPQFALGRAWSVPPAFAAYAAPDSDAEAHLTGLITFAEGCVLQYERAEFSTLPAQSHWIIAGERASLTLQMLPYDPPTRLVLTEPDPVQGTRSTVIWEGDESTSPAPHDGPVQDFVAAILEKRPPRTTLQDSLLLARITDALYASADTGQPVPVA